MCMIKIENPERERERERDLHSDRSREMRSKLITSGRRKTISTKMFVKSRQDFEWVQIQAGRKHLFFDFKSKSWDPKIAPRFRTLKTTALKVLKIGPHLWPMLPRRKTAGRKFVWRIADKNSKREGLKILAKSLALRVSKR